MTQRAYTVSEIDELREMVGRRWLYGTCYEPWKTIVGRSYNEAEKTKCVEEILRTHMLAGHIAADLAESNK